MHPRSLLLLAPTLSLSTLIWGHPGRTDANGGHHDRKNGGYHYHNSGSTYIPPPAPKQEPKPIVAPTITRRKAESKIEISPPPKLPEQEFSEKLWTIAFNEKVTKGRVAVTTNGGLVDILTDEYAIEVERVSKYQEGIIQALRLAEATELRAGLALYIDGDENAFETYAEAADICVRKEIKLWLINSDIRLEDLTNLEISLERLNQ